MTVSVPGETRPVPVATTEPPIVPAPARVPAFTVTVPVASEPLRQRAVVMEVPPV